MSKLSQAVSSSMISSVEYDTDEKLLSVTFTSGTTVDYEDVPESEYFGLIHAPSVGKYFHSAIKDAYSTR
jgi:hypothetical protein